MPNTSAAWTIYHDEFHSGVMERVDQIVDVFNEKSAGAIQLVSQMSRGHFQKESFFKNLTSAVTRRDLASVSTATEVAMTTDEEVRVKLNRKFGPVAQTLESFRKLGMDSSEMSYLLGFKMGEEKARDMINAALTCAKGAMGIASAAGASAALDAFTATGADGPKVTHRNLASMLSKLGDMAQNVVCFVMHSAPFFDLLKSSFNNAAGTGINLTQVVAGIAIMEGSVQTFGRPVIVTDSPGLIDPAHATNSAHLTFGLVESGISVFESEEQEVASAIVTGLENLVARFQGEWAFNVGLKGYKYVVAAGTNPADTALVTAGSWTKVASAPGGNADKLGFGACLITNAA